ncbi:type II toxin-antitoxin system VapC family toxin [Candidatus Electronema sp. JC]|uniref:type II toxin-antitoxin system VapC family toxin n=1 Tax=Candidatus Electronema sp. JC TaxID=3401570 RepID=UPI003B43C80B
MTALLDTSFLLAMTNSKDHNHARVLDVAAKISDNLIVPVTVLPEVSYLIGSRLGHKAMRQFLGNLAASDVAVEMVTKDDLKRVTAILTEYADSRLDFVDATIVALAERLNITRILTLDRRDFTIIRPKHHPYFEILP